MESSVEMPDPDGLRSLMAKRPIGFAPDWLERRADRLEEKRRLVEAGEWNKQRVISFANEILDQWLPDMYADARNGRSSHRVFDTFPVHHGLSDEHYWGPEWVELDVLEELADRFTAAGFAVTWADWPEAEHVGFRLTVSW
jgi:hypothetical protein